MTEIDEPFSSEKLEEIVNTIVKKTIGRSLTDIETKIIKGIYYRKTYPALAEEISHTEQHIKNTASSLFKILNASKLLKEEVNKSNFISIFQRYKINSQNDYKRAKNNKLILVNGEINKLNVATLIAFVKSLQGKGQDVTIEIIDVEEGSIKITIQGTEEGLTRIQKLFDSENLETLEGFEVLEIRDLNEEEQKKLKAKSIREVDLSWADLSEADLSEADLRGANLNSADLIEANLIEADLSWANLSWANLSWADLRGADLRGANLIEADLSKADLREANLSKADLSKADLREANLSKINLSKINLSWADLRGADLRGANLGKAKLRVADLRGADLRGADLIEADLGKADLRGANLIEADLGKANLSKADLRVDDLRGAYVKNARFTSTKGINPEQKDNLIARGAIFDNSPHIFSKVTT